MHLVEIGKLEELWENNLLKWNEITMWILYWVVDVSQWM